MRALAARGHEPVVFARHASTRAAPGPRDRRRRARSRGASSRPRAAATRCATRPRSSASGAAIRASSTPSTSADSNTRSPPRATLGLVARRLHVVVPRAAAGGTTRRRSAPTTTSAPKSSPTRSRHARATPAPRSSASIPAWSTGRASVSEGNLLGRLIADHLAGRLARPDRSRTRLVVRVDRRRRRAHVDGARARAAGHRTTSSAARTSRRCAVRDRCGTCAGTALPRRIPYSLAAAWARVEELRAPGSPAVRRCLTRGTVEIFRHDWPVDSAAAVRDLGYRVRRSSKASRCWLSVGPRAWALGTATSGRSPEATWCPVPYSATRSWNELRKPS